MSELPLWALGLIGAGLFFILMFLRMHVGLSLMIAGFVGIWLSRGLEPALNTLATTVWRVGNSQYLVVIPLFVLMGIVAGQGRGDRERLRHLQPMGGSSAGRLGHGHRRHLRRLRGRLR